MNLMDFLTRCFEPQKQFSSTQKEKDPHKCLLRKENPFFAGFIDQQLGGARATLEEDIEKHHRSNGYP